ncbi:hypothetical protein ACEWY4_005040 [Coilia grayii]|uniref:Uncharacterized protein n=1 Tax=Coilia grayii TaxID=363190 RepID=A0ABD1KH67_9TELE
MVPKFSVAKPWVTVCCVCVLLCWLQVCHSRETCDSALKLHLKTVVKNRIPEVIYEAVCDADYCDYPDGDSDTHESLNVVPITQMVLVLQAQRGQSRGYTAHYRRVAVGCTCMWAKTA